MYIKGVDDKLPRLWKASENLLRPLGAKKPYVVTLDDQERVIFTISRETSPDKLSKTAKILHFLFFLTVIPPLFLLIARTAYRASYDLKEKIKELKESVNIVAQPHFTAPPTAPTQSAPPEPVLPTPDGSAAEKALFNRFGTYSFLDHAASHYLKVIPHQKWKTPQAKNFLYFELQRIANELHNLEADCVADHTLKPLVSKLKLDVLKEMAALKPGKVPEPVKPEGIKNVGNSCYMNAALQPLLALRDIRQLLPEKLQKFPGEKDADFKKRLKIYRPFVKLILLHQKKNASPDELGEQVAELRKRIFSLKLLQGGFLDPDDEKNMADSGSFFELLTYVVGWSIQEKITSIPIDGNGADLNYQKVESTPKGVAILLHKGSVQEAIAKYSEAVVSDAQGWTTDIPGLGKDIPIHSKRDTPCIEGDPPNVLVFRVENRVIDPDLDGRVDASSMFEKKPSSKDATYELVGFCQNIQQAHWTSVVKTDQGWTYCNDSSTRVVNPQDSEFRHPANYVVYRKVQI